MQSVLRNVFLIYSILFLLSCESKTETKNIQVIVLSAERLKQLLENNDEVLLVDVRSPQEYHAGFIEGAVNIDVRSTDFDNKMKHFDRGTPIAVYCAKGMRSAKAAERLKVLGFETIYDLQNGYNAWMAKEKK